ncbi:hypothetical protein N7523_005704 [Penicillium sp. IBT 18751x]|nr:hypothetical protein N7523_005704 [Penicillium sp. IBT 18751x]
MSSTRLSHQLEILADRARQHEERYGEADSLLGRQDPQFVHQLQGILHRVAGRALRRQQQKDMVLELKDKNRTLQSLRSSSVPALEPEAIATIWGWAKDKGSFLTPAGKTDPCSPILDSVCKRLNHNTTAAVLINTIHTRLLLYFFARFVDEKLEDVRDLDRVVQLVLESGWISNEPEIIALFKDNFSKWLRAGRRYVGLVELLDVGEGVIIFLPPIKPSTWESHCPRAGTYANQIKTKLHEMGVSAAADARHDGWTAHEVVREVVEHLFAQSSTSFVPCQPATDRPSRWLRRSRDPQPSQQSSPSAFSGDYSSDASSPVAPTKPPWNDWCYVFEATNSHLDPSLLQSPCPQAVG